MAGVPGIEPGNGGIKIRCLTAWLHPNPRLTESEAFPGLIRAFGGAFKGGHRENIGGWLPKRSQGHFWRNAPKVPKPFYERATTIANWKGLGCGCQCRGRNTAPNTQSESPAVRLVPRQRPTATTPCAPRSEALEAVGRARFRDLCRDLGAIAMRKPGHTGHHGFLLNLPLAPGR